jgi:hypothetical protein
MLSVLESIEYVETIGDFGGMTPAHWRQIEDLYHAVQERSPSERAALLECKDPSTYAYIKASVHANLFRIPLR